MKRIIVVISLLGAAGVLLWFFPLFHVVSLEEAEAEKRQAAFDPAEYAKKFWDGQLVPSLDQATDAAAMLAAFRESPDQARNQFGRSVGLGRTYYYVLRGSGTIVSVDKKGVGISLRGERNESDVVLPTGLLFGNTVRDATGLLDPSDFPDSQHFNAISTELNHLVETLVIPLLNEQAKVGRRIEFVGCAEVTNEHGDLKPLKVIPLEVKLE
jgi:predicted lipoprotein